MSPVGDTDDESAGAENPTVTTAPAGHDAANSQNTVASTTAPWQRATSSVRGTASGSDEVQAAPTYRTYADDGYSSAGERDAAQQREDASTPPPLLSGTAAPGAQGSGRSSVDLGAGGYQAGTGGSGRGPTPTALRRPGRGPRRASLQLKRFDPWSVLKLALVLCFAMFFVWMVAVGVLYGALDGMGVWDKINGTYNSLAAPAGSSSQLISAGTVFGVAAIVGAINIILFTALATIGAFVYNVSADLVGGLEVTLAERE